MTCDHAQSRTANTRLAARSENQKVPAIVTYCLQDEVTDVACLNDGVNRNCVCSQSLFDPIQLFASRLIGGE